MRHLCKNGANPSNFEILSVKFIDKLYIITIATDMTEEIYTVSEAVIDPQSD